MKRNRIVAAFVLAAMLLGVLSGCGTTETAECSHDWGEGTRRVVSTACSDMGVCTYTCRSCGKTRVEQVRGDHTFGPWEYEEYTYSCGSGNGTDESRISHRKVRFCEKCGYKETAGTPDHVCEIGGENHTTQVLREDAGQNEEVIRSTCSVCGWHADFQRVADAQ